MTLLEALKQLYGDADAEWLAGDGEEAEEKGRVRDDEGVVE